LPITKYSNKKTLIDGVYFSSKKEAQRYLDLKLLQKNNYIRELELQPKFLIHPEFIDFSGKKHRPIYYVADFKYWDIKDKKYIIEDVKGMKTEVYKLKKKLFLAKYAFKFIEV
jgi:hypothetical protein